MKIASAFHDRETPSISIVLQIRVKEINAIVPRFVWERATVPLGGILQIIILRGMFYIWFSLYSDLFNLFFRYCFFFLPFFEEFVAEIFERKVHNRPFVNPDSTQIYGDKGQTQRKKSLQNIPSWYTSFSRKV